MPAKKNHLEGGGNVVDQVVATNVDVSQWSLLTELKAFYKI